MLAAFCSINRLRTMAQSMEELQASLNTMAASMANLQASLRSMAAPEAKAMPKVLQPQAKTKTAAVPKNREVPKHKAPSEASCRAMTVHVYFDLVAELLLCMFQFMM